MWLSFSFKSSAEQQDVLLALLDSIGFEGFEQKENEVIAFIPETKFSETVFLETIQPLSVSFEKMDVAEENWNEQWEKNFQPIIIEHKIGVRASFHQLIKNVEHEIIIDPKMSFGTGHHATTEMMMRLMTEENISGKTVLDFGCGTGILSILASKLGAASVLAIDNDHWAVENCRENFVLNGIEIAEVIWGDSVPADKKFDFILANITRDVIIKHFKAFSEALTKNGHLLISGFLESDQRNVLSAAYECRFILTGKLISGEWMSASFELSH